MSCDLVQPHRLRHFDQPTSARVCNLCMAHAHMIDGRIGHEWLLTDEVAVWKQVLGARRTPIGAASGRHRQGAACP